MQAGTTSIDGYTNLLRQLTTFIFKIRKEIRLIHEINEDKALAHDSHKAYARDPGCTHELGRTHPDGDGQMRGNLQQAILQEQAAGLQRRVDEQLHVNAQLKGNMTCLHEQVCITG